LGQDEDQVRGRAGGAGGGRRARGGRPAPWTPASSFIIKVMDYRELLDERILRCGERRSKAVVRPQRRSAPTHIGTAFTPYTVYAQIARAHRRSLPRRSMSLLMAWLERQLTIGI